MNKLSLIKEKFNQDVIEPIFDYELYELGITDEDIEDTLEEKVFERVETDLVPCKVFTLVLYAELFDLYSKYEGTEDDIVYKYYIGKNNEYGYVTGLALLNKLGLITQNAFYVKIVTNRDVRVSTIGRNELIEDKNYKVEDLPYIYLKTIIDFGSFIEYDISDRIDSLKSKITDKDKLFDMVKNKERFYEIFASK